MPGPYRAAAGKPTAVRKRPRRGQDPSLRTDPSTSARIPPQVRAATRQRAAPPRRGRRPRRSGSLLPPPIPGKTPGPGMPGPYRAAVGKPPAVHKRPRRGQDPSLRTAPSTNARPYSAYVNDIRRAGCPHPAASSRNHPSTGSHSRRGRRPRRPGNLPSPPIPGKTTGPGMPGPYRAAAGKPHAVHKRPRRGQDPSLRTDPSTSACTPPQVRAATRQRAATHVGGGVPDAPEISHPRENPRAGYARPLPRGGAASPMPSVNARGGVKTPPYGPPHQRVPAPRRAAVRERRQKTEAIPFPGTASVLYISI